MYRKFLVNGLFLILILLITFFGIGPVLMADGSLQERMITFFIVLLCYLFLWIGYKYFKKHI
ncbi:MAG: hypothetical protein JM58_05915 [Peptococcaceae bacterium BICA1-8]|nr:MAG: hypothetical protein JM58_05915 [Peptococcaceae bacterium BICA1-8]